MMAAGRHQPSREPRRQLVNFIWYRLLATEPEGSNDQEASGIARSCDVSSHGVGLYTARALPVGHLVFLEIATGRGTLSAVGRVVHSQPAPDGRFRAGIRIEVVPPNDRGILARIVGHDR